MGVTVDTTLILRRTTGWSGLRSCFRGDDGRDGLATDAMGDPNHVVVNLPFPGCPFSAEADYDESGADLTRLSGPILLHAAVAGVTWSSL
jgi:hypothetical protein